METIIPLLNFNEPFASSGGSVRAKKRRDDLETQKKRWKNDKCEQQCCSDRSAMVMVALHGDGSLSNHFIR